MALSFWGASIVLAARQSDLPFGSVLMLGRQSCRLTTNEIKYLSDTYEYRLDPNHLAGEYWAEPYFHALGADFVESLDYSDYEGARYVHDMNLPWPEGHPPRQFDIVFDGGTLEHVFNYPQALLNAMSLVTPGGCLLSVPPVDGWLGHGFYQPQPELFFRLLTPERGFHLRGVWLAEFGRASEKSRLFHIKDPALTGCRPLVPTRCQLSMIVFAEKIAEFQGPPAWPPQSNYTMMWKQAEDDPSDHVGTHADSFAATLRRFLAKSLPGVLRESLQRWLITRKRIKLARAGWDEVIKLEGAAAAETDSK